MGWLSKLLGKDEAAERIERTEALVVDAGIAGSADELAEVDVVGEASYQDTLERLAGPKDEIGKELRVGATLRCEPTNSYDSNAIRVEVMGQLVGYVPRGDAARLAPALAAKGGVVEGQGLIVGGWRRGRDEGFYGIRVWLARDDAERLGVPIPLPSPPVAAAQTEDAVRLSPWPHLPPPAPGEVRLSPAENDFDTMISTVTVTCEEHYQSAIERSKPAVDWNRDSWPCLMTLGLADSNPHKDSGPCVEVRIGGDIVGYLTPGMTERHGPTVQQITSAGKVASVRAHVGEGTKGGQSIWRIKLLLTKQ